MTNQLNIAMAQVNQRVGDLAYNAAAMLEWRVKAGQADLIVFPEQQLIGYPAEDLVLKPVFAARAAEELAKLAAATADGGPAMLVGSIFVDGGALYNGLALLDGGRIAVGLLPRTPALALARIEPYGLLVVMLGLFILPHLVPGYDPMGWFFRGVVAPAFDFVLMLTGHG